MRAFVIAGFERGGILLAGLVDGGEGILIFALAALDFSDVDEGLGVFGIGFGKQLELLEGLVELVVGEQGLAQGVEGVGIAGVHIGSALVGGDGVFGLLELVIGGAQGDFHLGAAVADGDGFNHLGGVGYVAALGIETGEVEDHFFRIGLDGLGGLELVFRLFGLVLDGVELAKDHAVIHALGLERNDLLELGDGLVENVAGGRGRRDGVGGVAQLAQIDAAEEAMGVDVVGRAFEQAAGGDFGIVEVPGAEVEIGEAIIELRRGGVGVEGVLVLVDGEAGVVVIAGLEGLVFIHVGEGEVIVGHGAIGLLGGCGGRRSSAGGSGLGW